MDFEDAQFYISREHFDVEKWWRASAIIGALPMFACFSACIGLLIKLKPLWRASEESNPLGENFTANMSWFV